MTIEHDRDSFLALSRAEKVELVRQWWQVNYLLGLNSMAGAVACGAHFGVTQNTVRGLQTEAFKDQIKPWSLEYWDANAPAPKCDSCGAVSNGHAMLDSFEGDPEAVAFYWCEKHDGRVERRYLQLANDAYRTDAEDAEIERLAALAPEWRTPHVPREEIPPAPAPEPLGDRVDYAELETRAIAAQLVSSPEATQDALKFLSEAGYTTEQLSHIEHAAAAAMFERDVASVQHVIEDMSATARGVREQLELAGVNFAEVQAEIKKSFPEIAAAEEKRKKAKPATYERVGDVFVKLPDAPYLKCCPTCKREVQTHEEAAEVFGFREVHGKLYMQSRCPKCR